MIDLKQRVENVKKENDIIISNINKYNQEVQKLQTVYTANLGRIDELTKLIEDDDDE